MLVNDSNPDGDPIRQQLSSSQNGTVCIHPDGTLIYTPEEDYSGTDTLTYTVTDGINVSAPATVTIMTYSIPYAGYGWYESVAGQTLDTGIEGGPGRPMLGRGRPAADPDAVYPAYEWLAGT